MHVLVMIVMPNCTQDVITTPWSRVEIVITDGGATPSRHAPFRCTHCAPEMQLEVARCLDALLGNVFGGKHRLSPRDAKVVFRCDQVNQLPESESSSSASD